MDVVVVAVAAAGGVVCDGPWSIENCSYRSFLRDDNRPSLTLFNIESVSS